jgi:arylsulfatase A-like enzyme
MVEWLWKKSFYRTIAGLCKKLLFCEFFTSFACEGGKKLNKMSAYLKFIIIGYFLMAFFAPCVKLEAKENQPNILLFTIDACRPDHFGCYGYTRNTTPNIDKLTKEGMLFTHAFCQSAWTTPGMISIFTSLYPPAHAVDAKDKTLQEDVLTLPKILKRNGYTVPVLPRFIDIPNYWHLGFDAVNKEQFQGKEGEDLLKLLEAYKDQKFFIWYHYHGLHLPYNPPSPYDAIFLKDDKTPSDSEAVAMVKKQSVIRQGSAIFHNDDKDTVITLYDGQIRQLDDYIRLLIERMKEWDIFNNTIIIITSDHGEELFEHGFLGHASTSLNAKLYEEIIRIPLIILWPKKLKHAVINRYVQQVDIMPTILDFLGLPVPDGLQGNSLLPLMEDKSLGNLRSVPAYPKQETVFCETVLGGYQSTKEMEKIRLRCIRIDRWKLIHTNNALDDLRKEGLNDDKDTFELYDLKSDPGEENNIVKKHPDVVNELKQRLFQWIETTTSK